jgi:hypothetical protein
MNHPMNKSQQENMMPASYLKYKTLVASETRCVDLLPSRPSVMFGLIGALLIAVPLPAFAESGSSDNISIALSSSVVGNPIGQDDVSNTAPGAIVDFSVVVKGPTERGAPATSFGISDKVPEHLSLFVGDLQGSGSGPAAFTDHDSGLQFSFDGLSNANDSVEFSSDGGATFDYIPVPDADGFDANVTHVRFRPRGALLMTTGPKERFSLRYRMKVK